MDFSYQHNGQTYTVKLEPQPDNTFRVVIGDRTYHVVARQTADGVWQISLDGQPMTVYTAGDAKARYIMPAGGSAYVLTPAESLRRTRRVGAEEGGAHLTAQMPGQVIDVYVSVGDQVKSGQTLAVLEAMKMEIRVTSPTDGVVRAVFVKKGDVVERDQRLMDVGSDS